MDIEVLFALLFWLLQEMLLWTLVSFVWSYAFTPLGLWMSGIAGSCGSSLGPIEKPLDCFLK